jgi:hypothetical protein
VPPNTSSSPCRRNTIMFLHNKIAKGILHNIVHKITSVLWGSLRLLKNKNNEIQIRKGLAHRISTVYGRVYGLHGKFGLRPYGHYALLWINIIENRNCLTSFSRNFSYRISTKSAKRFMRYMENSIYSLCKLGYIMGQYGWKLESPTKSWWKSPISHLEDVCEMVYGAQRKVHVWLYTGSLGWGPELTIINHPIIYRGTRNLETVCNTGPVHTCPVRAISFSLWFHVLCGERINRNMERRVGLRLKVKGNQFQHLL